MIGSGSRRCIIRAAAGGSTARNSSSGPYRTAYSVKRIVTPAQPEPWPHGSNGASSTVPDAVATSAPSSHAVSSAAAAGARHDPGVDCAGLGMSTTLGRRPSTSRMIVVDRRRTGTADLRLEPS